MPILLFLARRLFLYLLYFLKRYTSAHAPTTYIIVTIHYIYIYIYIYIHTPTPTHTHTHTHTHDREYVSRYSDCVWGWRIGVQPPERAAIIFQEALKPSHSPTQWIPGGSTLDVKQLKREPEHSTHPHIVWRLKISKPHLHYHTGRLGVTFQPSNN